jgi:diguanylate cyclase (GGDEF)-like protein
MDLIQESEVDVLLCDYNLSETDAIALNKQIQEALGESTPPMLVVSDYDSASLRASCASGSITGLHVKTDTEELLVDRVTSLVKNDTKRHRVEQSSRGRQLGGGTDPLTSIASKAHFVRRFNSESSAAYRDQTPLSLLMIALDRFDRVFFRKGQQMSDSVLAGLARLIEGDLRSRDCAARFEDHTFAVVLPETTLKAAVLVGRRLGRKIAATQLGNLDHPISITVSIGCTCRPHGVVTLPDDLVKQAIRSCNAAQAMGGDRVVADEALTGKPLVLLVADIPSPETDAMIGEISASCNVEVRVADSFDKAREILKQIPVALTIANNAVQGKTEGVQLLSWIRKNYPAIHRILIADEVSADLMETTINDAAVHYFVAMSPKRSNLAPIVDRVLFK